MVVGRERRKTAAGSVKPPEAARARILDAALDLFGDRGLTGATVRAIATRAQVNVAAVSYYFGGKEELYKAVAGEIADRIAAGVLARAATVVDRPPTDPAAALAALETLALTIVDVVVGPQEMRRVARFVIREQMQPSGAFDILFGTMSRLHVAGCLLFAAAAGIPPEAPETKLRVFMMIGQALFLRVGEAVVLRRMALQRYDADFLEMAKALLRQNVRALVSAAREPLP